MAIYRLDWQRADLHIVLVNPQIPQNAGRGWRRRQVRARSGPSLADQEIKMKHVLSLSSAGNIARTAAATAVALHLVEPLGFSLSDKQLKRGKTSIASLDKMPGLIALISLYCFFLCPPLFLSAGLDYWKSVCVKTHPSWKVSKESGHTIIRLGDQQHGLFKLFDQHQFRMGLS